ncbi:hypothetical protein DEIPH_ctg008orf0173 [Deinococcus phoenicis]|uniref:Uncharacterized protein n=1 Tax=Deinococcus phoenicis TaxID=1476583 RepID=A0A016QUG6_9DEIO|nr:hypothetical protein [Deinococcus phoenicis]EYB69434.1 hypothetical protein DEIPH_ctg008orf0173 [Deinococcus phoenicis]
MNKRIVVKFVPPAPVKVPNGKSTTRTRTWQVDRLIEFLRSGLEPLVTEAYPGTELEVIEGRAADVRFDGWKPEKPAVLREQIGEMIGTVMEDLEAEEYLNA